MTSCEDNMMLRRLDMLKLEAINQYKLVVSFQIVRHKQILKMRQMMNLM